VTIRLVVVFGGNSPEHEVSLAGAKAVLGHVLRLGWDVLPVGVSRGGQWIVGPGALAQLWSQADPGLLPRGHGLGDRVPGRGEPYEVFHSPPPSSVFSEYQFAFPVCHGRWGEDGTLQGYLTCHGLRLVGSGVAASAVCFDKHLARSVLSAAGLPVTPGTLITAAAFNKDFDLVLDRVLDTVGAAPWFVKPARGGSSLGVGRSGTKSSLRSALREAFRWDDAALVEEDIPHRELVLGVLGSSGNGEVTVSVPGECVPVGDLYTYEEKYRLGNPGFVCPPDLPPHVVSRAADLAAEAYRALGCDVFARIDLFLDRRTDELLINEINTIPGLTEVSVFPKVMAASGYPYPHLLAELVRIAAGPPVPGGPLSG
jgi:D-alanine-D-alanine ligase